MTTVTLAAIETKQTELAKLIEQFKAAQQPTFISIAYASIQLAPGEQYAGMLLDDDGKPSHHLVLLPGQAEDIKWSDAKAWAATLGGTLPTRREQALLFANLKGSFEGAWYWSSEEHTNGSSAWLQFFTNGYQGYNGKSFEGRARAVRRLPA